MTTIAHKDGVIAYDSRVTSGATIIYDDYEKCVTVKGVQFVLSGSTSDYETFIDAYFGTAPKMKIDVVALVIDGDQIWCASHSEGDGFWKCPVLPNLPYAIGSGSDHALTAMDMGATAVEAVEAAIKRDSGTGGRVRALRVGERIIVDPALGGE